MDRAELGDALAVLNASLGATRLARRVFPVWVYVSLTGLVVHVLPYQVHGYT